MGFSTRSGDTVVGVIGWLRQLFAERSSQTEWPFPHKPDCPDPDGATYFYEREGHSWSHYTCNLCGAKESMD